MSRLGPLYAAVAIFPLVAAGAALPYVAIQYRRRGTLGAGQIVLAAALCLYLTGLAFAVILPLRPVTPDFCQLLSVHAKLKPLHLFTEVRLEHARGGWSAVFGDSDVQDLMLNVLLFIPLGMFARHMLRRGAGTAIALGFCASLVIELTQLTGNWGLYPCAYRFFSFNDLYANTAGTALGVACAPILRLIPAQASPEGDPRAPRPVTAQRRFLAALCNLAIVAAAGFALLAVFGVLLQATRGELFVSDSLRAGALRAFALVLVPGTAALLVVPLLWQGRTLGEWAVFLRPAGTGAGAVPPSTEQIVARFVIVSTPMLALAAAAVAGSILAGVALMVLGSVHAWLLTRASEWRGGAELRVGIQVVDSR